jgi:hypothetical protein
VYPQLLGTDGPGDQNALHVLNSGASGEVRGLSSASRPKTALILSRRASERSRAVDRFADTYLEMGLYKGKRASAILLRHTAEAPYFATTNRANTGHMEDPKEAP